jgi:CubicO group peptidase (beta-lactamase class C family)
MVTPGTPFYNFSIANGAASAIAHILVERGLFDYDTPVAKLWPEFGAQPSSQPSPARAICGPPSAAFS